MAVDTALLEQIEDQRGDEVVQPALAGEVFLLLAVTCGSEFLYSTQSTSGSSVAYSCLALPRRAFPTSPLLAFPGVWEVDSLVNLTVNKIPTGGYNRMVFGRVPAVFRQYPAIVRQAMSISSDSATFSALARASASSVPMASATAIRRWPCTSGFAKIRRSVPG